MIEITEIIKETENCIKEGQFSQARKLLDTLVIRKIPRQWLLKCSNLSRRCGLVERSLKILNPVVVHKSTLEPASDAEIADYAFSLYRIGAVAEAERYLVEIDPCQTPKALFFRSIIHFSRWAHSEAEPLLLSYMEDHNLSDYQRLMAQSNLVTAYLETEQFTQAESLAGFLLDQARNQKLGLLENLCLEQLIELYWTTDKLTKVKSLLQKAIKQAEDSGELVQLWLWKWQQLFKARKMGMTQSKNFLNKTKQEALQKGAWEVARDIDFQLLKMYDDHRVFDYLYFGSPYPGFRQRLQKISSRQPPSSYLYQLAPGTPKKIINLGEQTMTENGETISLKLTSKHFDLLRTVVSDFYRPKKWGGLFDQVFPGEHYDPFTSVNRLHQLLHRFNKFSLKNSLSFKISSHPTGVHVQESEFIGFELSLVQQKNQVSDPLLAKIIHDSRFKEEFNIHDLKKVLPGSERRHQRFLKKMIDEGKITKIGRGSQSRYKIAS